MRFLRLPEGMASISVFEQTFAANESGAILGPDGKGVEDHVAREIMAHDPRITEFTPDSADDPSKMPGAGDRRVIFLSRAASLDRTELFAAARLMRVSMPATLKTEQMREIIIRHAATIDEGELPMLIGGGTAGPGDGITMLNPEDAASLNRGNDGLGSESRPGVMTGAAPAGPGATFSQGQVGPGVDAAARPAPSGLGPVQATGTQQPPFNQLSTETGRPAHDDSMAAFPISVPPIDPATGQPFAEGDPRIPHHSRPALREDPDGLSERQHGSIDQQEYAAGDRIRDIADNLAWDAKPGSRVPGDGKPLLTDKEEGERQAALTAKIAAENSEAANGAGKDPNHGNDTEGKKSPDAPVKN